jgi:site-specific DNA-cytosine methylase
MKKLNVLVACECSGKVREAFRALGHHAISCDIQPSDDNSPHHIQGDALKAIELMEWDLLIGFPPCTHLASSGARWFEAKRADGRQQQAIDFFMELANAPIPHIALENPIGIMSSEYRKPRPNNPALDVRPWRDKSDLSMVKEFTQARTYGYSRR